MKTNRTLLSLSLSAAAFFCFGTAQANNFSRPVYEGAKAEVKARYKAEREACTGKKANAMDVCLEVAKGREKVSLAQLELNYTGKKSDEMALWEAKIEARHDIAKEKCDDLTGKDKDVCQQAAESAYDKSKANMKLAKKTDAAVEDADEAHMKADYKLAAEKCNAYSGDKKDICIASAKAHYNQGW